MEVAAQLRSNDFLALLPQHVRCVSSAEQQRARTRDWSILVPEDMSLERAVVIASETGQAVVLRPGDHVLEAPLLVRGKVAIRAEGGVARIIGTTVFGSGSGHVKGLTFVGQGDDSIRVEGGTWAFANCIMSCDESSAARSCCALWVASGKVSLFECLIGQGAMNALAACGDAVVEADMCKIAGSTFGAGAADHASLDLKGCEVFNNQSAFVAGPRPGDAILTVLDSNIYGNAQEWNDKSRPKIIKERNTGF